MEDIYKEFGVLSTDAVCYSTALVLRTLRDFSTNFRQENLFLMEAHTTGSAVRRYAKLTYHDNYQQIPLLATEIGAQPD